MASDSKAVNIVLSLCGGLAISTTTFFGMIGVKAENSRSIDALVPTSYTITQTSANQLFRDHDGYRVFEELPTGEIKETHFSDNKYCGTQAYPILPSEEAEKFRGLNEKNGFFKLYRDVKAGHSSYVINIDYEMEGYALGRNQKYSHCTYTEIHLAEDHKLSPGSDVYGGKFRQTQPMMEVK